MAPPQVGRVRKRLLEEAESVRVTEESARRTMKLSNYFAAMMVEQGDADGIVSGISRSYPDTIRPALELFGTRPEVRRVAGAYLIILEDTVTIFADTTVNIDPSAEDLAEIALATAEMARGLDIEPHVAMLSFSNFGSNRSPQASKRGRAVELPSSSPDLDVDGEMQVGAALDVEQRGRLFSFSTLKEEANISFSPN